MNTENEWDEEDPSNMPNCTVLKHAIYGYVTVDFDKRIFSIGMGLPRSWLPSMAYSGKGWKERIVADAKAHLSGCTPYNLRIILAPCTIKTHSNPRQR